MSLSSAQLERLQRRLDEWEGTPYMAGQCKPGKRLEDGCGVDCVRLGDDALQYALGLSLDPLPREAQDAAFHDPNVVFRFQRLMLKRFRGTTLDPQTIKQEAGDILGLKLKDAAKEHHVAIVGADGVRCYHAIGAGVVWSGIGGIRASYDVLKIWRPGEFPC